MRIVPVEQPHEVVLHHEQQLEHRCHEPRLSREQQMRAQRDVDAFMPRVSTEAVNKIGIILCDFDNVYSNSPITCSMTGAIS